MDQLSFLPGPPPEPAPAPVATYIRYVTKSVHHVCRDCYLAADLAARHGQARPPARSVAWRRQYGEEVTLLCYRHKAEAHAADRAGGVLAKPTPAARRAKTTA